MEPCFPESKVAITAFVPRHVCADGKMMLTMF